MSSIGRLDKITGFPRSRLPRHHLPTKLEIICFYRYQKEILQKTYQECLKYVVEDLVSVWDEAGCRHQLSKNINRKLKKLVEECKGISKDVAKASLPAIRKIQNFKAGLHSVFDIKCSESGQCRKFKERSSSAEETIPVLGRRLRTRLTPIQRKANETQESEVEDLEDLDYVAPQRKRPVKRINVINNSVAESLDREKISSRGAVGVLGSVIDSLDLDLNYVTLSKSSTHRKRKNVD